MCTFLELSYGLNLFVDVRTFNRRIFPTLKRVHGEPLNLDLSLLSKVTEFLLKAIDDL